MDAEDALQQLLAMMRLPEGWRACLLPPRRGTSYWLGDARLAVDVEAFDQIFAIATFIEGTGLPPSLDDLMQRARIRPATRGSLSDGTELVGYTNGVADAATAYFPLPATREGWLVLAVDAFYPLTNIARSERRPIDLIEKMFKAAPRRQDS